MGYLCLSRLLPGCSCNVGESSTEVDFIFFVKEEQFLGVLLLGGLALGLLDVEYLGRHFFSALVWPQIVCLQQVVEECAGSGVGAQLLNPGLSKLCHPGDCLLGLQNHLGKMKQCG